MICPVFSNVFVGPLAELWPSCSTFGATAFVERTPGFDDTRRRLGGRARRQAASTVYAMEAAGESRHEQVVPDPPSGRAIFLPNLPR